MCVCVGRERERERAQEERGEVDQFQGTGLYCIIWGWPGMSEIHTVGLQEGQSGALRHKLKLQAPGGISSLGKPQFCS